jgi:hypothetical protein
MPSQSATSPSRDNYEKADKGKDPPASPKFQESVDSVDSNIASVEVELCSIDVDEMVNELAKEASFEINREELNSIEAEETADQLANEASREINREELSAVEQGETIEANETNCEIHTDMNDPAQYIHSIEKLDLATKKRLISRGPFQPKAHEMNEKQFPKSRCGSHDRSFNESWYNIKVGKTILKENGYHIHQKTMQFFVTSAFFSLAIIRNKRSRRLVIVIGKRPMRSLQSTKNLNVILTQELILLIFAPTFTSMNNFLTKPRRWRRQGKRRLERTER